MKIKYKEIEEEDKGKIIDAILYGTKRKIDAELKEEILEAIDFNRRHGKTLSIYFLDTGDARNDEWLIGESEEEVKRDVLYYHDLAVLPKGWGIKEVKIEEFRKL